MTGKYGTLFVGVSSHEHMPTMMIKNERTVRALSQRNQCRGARWGKQSKHSTTQPANHLAPLTTLHNRHPDNESGQCVGDITWVTDTWTVCRVRDVTRTQRHAPPNVERAPPVTTGHSCHRI